MGSTVSFLGRDTVLAEMNQKFAGNYLGETSLMAAARAQGWQTAAIGVEGPTRIQDPTANPDDVLMLDNSTGHKGGLSLPDWFTAGVKQALIEDAAPKPTVPDTEQEVWMTDAVTQIVLPHTKLTIARIVPALAAKLHGQTKRRPKAPCRCLSQSVLRALGPATAL